MKQDYIIFTKDDNSIEKWIHEINSAFINEVFDHAPDDEVMEIERLYPLTEISIEGVKLSSTRRVIDTILYFFENRKFLFPNLNFKNALSHLFNQMNSCAKLKSGYCYIHKKSFFPITEDELLGKPRNAYERYMYTFYTLSEMCDLGEDKLLYHTFKINREKDGGLFFMGNLANCFFSEFLIKGKEKIKLKHLVKYIPDHVIIKGNDDFKYEIKLVVNEGAFCELSKVDFLKLIIRSYDEHCENLKRMKKTTKSARK